MGKKQAASPIRSLFRTTLPERGRSWRRNREIRSQLRQGHHPGLGFLHIPKTGGSSIHAFGRQLVTA